MGNNVSSRLVPAISEAEQRVREDLAAAYRLVALYGMDDSIYTHISARVPGRSMRRCAHSGAANTRGRLSGPDPSRTPRLSACGLLAPGSVLSRSMLPSCWPQGQHGHHGGHARRVFRSLSPLRRSMAKP